MQRSALALLRQKRRCILLRSRKASCFHPHGASRGTSLLCAFDAVHRRIHRLLLGLHSRSERAWPYGCTGEHPALCDAHRGCCAPPGGLFRGQSGHAAGSPCGAIPSAAAFAALRVCVLWRAFGVVSGDGLSARTHLMRRLFSAAGHARASVVPVLPRTLSAAHRRTARYGGCVLPCSIVRCAWAARAKTCACCRSV